MTFDSAHALETLNKVPMKFQGQWAPSVDRCDTDPQFEYLDPELITINENSVIYYEASCDAISIIRRNVDEVAMIMECMGEGMEWLALEHVSYSGDQLTKMSGSNKLITYQKCPDKN
jgi:hypothetical protein